MKLYYSDILSSHRACAVARYLKAPVEFVYLDFAKGEQRAPAYLAINPNGKVPTLVKGDRIIWEADAVICQLSDDMCADLWPHDSRQLDIIRWFSWNAQHFTRAGGALYFENVVKRRFNLGPPDPAVVEEAGRRISPLGTGAGRSSCGPEMARGRQHDSRGFFRGDGAAVCRRSPVAARRSSCMCATGTTGSTRSRVGATRFQPAKIAIRLGLFSRPLAGAPERAKACLA